MTSAHVPRDQAGDLPVRMVSRLNSEIGLMNLHDLNRLVPGHFEAAIVLMAIVRNAVPHLRSHEGAFVLPHESADVGSIVGLARSFDRPTETIRRHAATLAEVGFITVSRRGLSLAATEPARNRILRFLTDSHDSTVWYIEQLADWGLLPTTSRVADPDILHLEILRSGLDRLLLPFESFRSTFNNNWIAMAIWNAIGVANVRSITADPLRSAQHYSYSTPDTERRAIGLRAVSAITGFPYSTVRRHVGALVTAGALSPHNGGYAVLKTQLLTPAMEARVANIVRKAITKAADMVKLGIDLTNIERVYMYRRPALVPLAVPKRQIT